MAVKKKTTKAKKLEFASISGKSVAELHTELTKIQGELTDVKRSHAARELVSTARIKELRRHIAHIKTAINKKSREENA